MNHECLVRETENGLIERRCTHPGCGMVMEYNPKTGKTRYVQMAKDLVDSHTGFSFIDSNSGSIKIKNKNIQIQPKMPRRK